jgi:hypothetical protein
VDGSGALTTILALVLLVGLGGLLGFGWLVEAASKRLRQSPASKAGPKNSSHGEV